jgi:hypothetical protein
VLGLCAVQALADKGEPPDVIARFRGGQESGQPPSATEYATQRAIESRGRAGADERALRSSPTWARKALPGRQIN